MADERKTERLLKSVINEIPWSDEAVEMFMLSAPERPMPDGMKKRLLDSLLEAQKERAIVLERLERPERLNSLGDLLSLIRKKYGQSTNELSSELGISAATLEHLERNDIPIFEVSIQEMKKILQKLNVELKAVFTLIRKSSALFGYKPNYLQGMARFDSSKSTESSKNQSMKRAFEELYLKKRDTKSNDEIETYLVSLEREILRG